MPREARGSQLKRFNAKNFYNEQNADGQLYNPNNTHIISVLNIDVASPAQAAAAII